MFGNLSATELDALLLDMGDAAARAIRNTPRGKKTIKAAYDGTPNADFFFEADRAAQTACEELRLQRMPESAVIGEEEGLRTEGDNASLMERGYFTIDGLDGTRRYDRGRRDGVGSLISYNQGGLTRAAIVVDVYCEKSYQLLAGGGVVRENWYTEFEPFPLRHMIRSMPLNEGEVLARGAYHEYDPVVRDLLANLGGFTWTRDISIGLSYAGLWTEDIVLHVQSPGSRTPWDYTPVDAIGAALDMVNLRPSADGRSLEVYEPEITMDVGRRTHCAVTLHRSRLAQLAELVPIVG